MTTKEELPQTNDQSINHCKERDVNDCWFFFTYTIKNDDNIDVLVAEKKGKNDRKTCHVQV